MARGDSYMLMREETNPNVFVVQSKQARAPIASMERTRKLLIAFVIVMGILIIFLVVVLEHIIKSSNAKTEQTTGPFSSNCTITLVESIPENVTFSAGSVQNPSIYDGWMNLLDIAEERIDIASFYWTLQGSDTKTTDYSTEEGETVFKKLQDVAKAGRDTSCVNKRRMLSNAEIR